MEARFSDGRVRLRDILIKLWIMIVKTSDLVKKSCSVKFWSVVVKFCLFRSVMVVNPCIARIVAVRLYMVRRVVLVNFFMARRVDVRLYMVRRVVVVRFYMRIQ